MGIVPASVHPARNSTGVWPFDLLNGQGIHVGAQGHAPRSGIQSFDLGDDAGSTVFSAPTVRKFDAD